MSDLHFEWHRDGGRAFCKATSETAHDLLINGHTHESTDYRIGSTRVLCNPYGELT